MGPGNNLWDHLNNQEGGGGGGGDTYIVQAIESVQVEIETLQVTATAEALEIESAMAVISATVDLNTIDIESELAK